MLAGHGERRHVFGEDEALVNRKVLAALPHDLLPILCVGKKLDERDAGRTAAVVERQVRACPKPRGRHGSDSPAPFGASVPVNRRSVEPPFRRPD